jgi:hypothetical protein
MSSTGGDDFGSAEDQAYFRILEERFLELRGQATLLSADDWSTAREWRRLGIPAELVVRVMEMLFQRQRERRSKRGISSLRYFRAAVEAAWSEQLELAAGGYRSAPEPGPSIAERLRALAAALPSDLPGLAPLRERLLRIEGGFEEVEAALERIDRELLSRLRDGLERQELAQLDARVDRALAAVLAAAPPEEVARARSSLSDRALRERFRLPVLSLFSPAALGPGES